MQILNIVYTTNVDRLLFVNNLIILVYFNHDCVQFIEKTYL